MVPNAYGDRRGARCARSWEGPPTSLRQPSPSRAGVGAGCIRSRILRESTCAKASTLTATNTAASSQIAAVRNTFLVRWTLADDVEVTGVGILNDNQLSVSYFGGTPAVVVYRDRRRQARWRMDDGRDGRMRSTRRR